MFLIKTQPHILSKQIYLKIKIFSYSNKYKLYNTLNSKKKAKLNTNTYKKIKKKIYNLLQVTPKFDTITVKPILKRKRRHKERNFWGSHKRNFPYLIRKKTKNQRKYKKRKLNFSQHYLNITLKRKNTFLTYYFKAKSRNKKKRKINILTQKSLGLIGYKGRHKTSPLAKESLGKTIGETIKKNNSSLIDIILKKKIGRIYKPLLKGLSKNRILIRKVIVKSIHSHGFIRPKKKKRK